MAGSGGRLQTVLGDYAKFLRDRQLAIPKHQSYLVRWVRDSPFLLARKHPGSSGRLTP
jgi:hypothetical protein